jgi:DNA-binding Xre family transcriptional regulator
LSPPPGAYPGSRFFGVRLNPTSLPGWSWTLWYRASTIGAVIGLPQQFGENVRRARHERGWTQEDLAAKTDLAVVQVSRIERGRREIRLSTLIRLLDGLDAQPDDLLRGLYGAPDTKA